MKKQISIPPAPHGHQMRLAPAGKHSLGLRTPGRHKKIAAKAEAKAKFLSQSSAEANRIANERQLARAWREFSAGLTPEQLAFARANGVHQPAAAGEARQRKADRKNNLEFADPAELPDSVGCGSQNGRKLVNRGEHPVDQLEPRKLSVQVDGLTAEEIRLTSETFGDCIRWALDDQDLVQRGLRAIVLVAAMRRDIAAGMIIDTDLADDFIADVFAVGDDSFEDLQAAGAVFGRFLEFISRGATKSSIGERLDMTAYMLRPDLLPANTLAKMGEIVNKTRQAKGKLSNDFRDTFGGLKSPAQRPEITRDRCCEAQLQPA
jgi:hypothetical protein